MTHSLLPIRAASLLLLVSLTAACSSNPPLASTLKTPASPQQVLADAERAAQFGDHARALSGWQSLLEKNPDDAVALSGMAETYLAAGKPALALLVFDQLLSKDAANIDAREGRGLAMVSLGRDEARKELEAVQRASPLRWRTLNALGFLLDMGNEQAQAQRYYSQALALQPNQPLILNNLGYSRLMAGDYVAAEEYFRDGLRAAPDGTHLHANMVLAIAWQGDYSRAVSEAVERQPQEEALNNVGYIALLRKDYKTAISYFEKAIEASPRWYPRAAANLERARQEAGVPMTR